MGTPIGTPMGMTVGMPMGKPMGTLLCFHGHGRAHGLAHDHGRAHGPAHGVLLCFYDDFYRYVAGQVSLTKSVPAYCYVHRQTPGLEIFGVCPLPRSHTLRTHMRQAAF